MLLAVPFITFAQSGPQMQVSNLQTSQTSYNAGQEITGSFVLNNIGDVNIPDLQYYVAVGNYGQDGGTLENETSVTPVSEALYLPAAARLEVPFSITPQTLPEGNLGLHVYVAQKNGMILGWMKIPLTIEGQRTNAQLINGYFEIGGEKYSLESNMPFAPAEGASFTLMLPEGTTDGTHDVRMTIYDKNVGQEVVSEQTIAVDFVEGIGQVLLPEDLPAKQYAGQVSLAKGSNVLSIKYSITGPQAEVLGVDTDLLSLKKGQDFVVTLNYADTPLNGRDPVATEYPDSLAVKIKVLNEKGKIVNEYQQALEVTQKQDLLEVNDESTEEEQKEATRRLEIMLSNTRVLDIPLSAKTSAKNLSFEVELYDEATGKVYDTYKTSFPAAPEEYPARAVLVATLASILILLVIIFKTAKHKIPMVCIALLVGLGVSTAVLVKDVGAWIAAEDYSNYNSQRFTFTAPISSRTDGYASTTSSITLDTSVTAMSWNSNGFLAHQIRYPVSAVFWKNFTSANAALSHIQLKTNHNNESLYFRNDQNATFSSTYDPLAYYYSTSGSNRLTPGKHWIPLSSRYCTASHGCAGFNYVVWEMCVDGAGVCANEPPAGDLCANIAGTQTSVPAGYTQDGPNCNVISCDPNQGAACGCPGNMGTIQCDGSCSVPTSCTSGLSVTCTGSPNPLTASGPVQFTAAVTGGTAPYTYTYEWVNENGTADQYLTRNITGPNQFQYVDVTDTTSGATGEGSCAVGYNSTSCTGPNPNEACYTCQGTTWVNMCTTPTTVSATFRFLPNIVHRDAQCTLDLEAENVDSCRLVRTSTGSVAVTVPADVVTREIDVNTGYQVSVGTYRLECQGIDVGDGFEQLGSPKQCIAAPLITEY